MIELIFLVAMVAGLFNLWAATQRRIVAVGHAIKGRRAPAESAARPTVAVATTQVEEPLLHLTATDLGIRFPESPTTDYDYLDIPTCFRGNPEARGIAA